MTNGYFFDTKSWSINTDGRGRRISWGLVLLLTPILGALFLMFLPLIGFYLLSQALTLKAWSLAESLFRPSAIAVGEAHILGSKTSGKNLGEVDDHVLEEIAKEIEQKRK